MSWQHAVLVLLVALPLAGSAAVAMLPGTADRLAVPLGIGTTALTFAGSLALLAGWLHRHGLATGGAPGSGAAAAGRPAAAGDTAYQLDVSWLRTFDIRFHLGVDGISLPLVVLTGLLTLLCLVYTAQRLPDPGRPRAFVALLLLLEVGMMGTFLALDLILFFVAFEVVLVPMYFLIGVWGGSERRGYAATKFILYTVLGSAFLLLGLLGIYTYAGHGFDMTRLASTGAGSVGGAGGAMSRRAQDLTFLALLIGFGIKTPMWPLHTWLPDAHTEAPTVGSVLLAGVLLKMGTYGLIRIALPALPQAAHDFAPYLGALAVVGIVYGALVCLAQRSLKRLIAYSSVGHMGFVLLGIATLTPAGINGALIGNIAHGLITGLLFFVVGSLKDRYHTDAIGEIGGGVLAKAPYLGGLLGFAAIASLGLPGLAGFWGEMLALLGAYRPAPGLSRPLFWVYLAVGGIGAVLTAAYLLWMLLRVAQGVVPARWRATRFRDATAVELAVWAPLVVLVLAVGLYPRLVLGMTTQDVPATVPPTGRTAVVVAPAEGTK